MKTKKPYSVQSWDLRVIYEKGNSGFQLIKSFDENNVSNSDG